MRGETAWLCSHPAVHRRSLALCFFPVITGKRELFHVTFHVIGTAVIEQAHSFPQMLETELKNKTNKATKHI